MLRKSLWSEIKVVSSLLHSAAAQALDPIPTASPSRETTQHHAPARPTPVGSPSQEAGETMTSISQCSILPRNFQWLLEYSPVFPISGSKVRVITDPNEFYRVLLSRASSASRRISLSSLYLGTEKLEKDFILAMDNRASICKNLRVHWLLDYTRGSRGDFNSRKMLQPLICKYPKTFTVSLYHTPDLRGFLKWIIPQRWNETIGLQHMKLYVFDDSLLISGANLSNDYFTNRQDRYFLFDDCPDLADFYHKIIGTVSKFSLQLQMDNTTSVLSETQVHPFLGDYNKYCSAMKVALQKVWTQECGKTSVRLLQASKRLAEKDFNKSEEFSGDSKLDQNMDTLVFPTLQMRPFNIMNDSVITKKFLATAESNSRIKLASGYFNLTEEYMQCILQQSLASCSILMAHPKANGFLGARGFAGAIPAAYTQIAKLFFERLQHGGQTKRISLFEYQRTNWTFHAKGLWYYEPYQSLPCLTMIGSPNFGWRSVNRDLETQVIVATKNFGLQSALYHEQDRLFWNSSPVTKQTFTQQDRLVPYWVRLVMPIIKVFF
ncbi:CDP-diacylglycerol--glycerol-3-phosphate 3-phosphatidyltransferase, mitochondrial isoform X2 [Procambarus clarkii]|uniref:CDP-diacylglycerol--glycerol-3-phosphate 3-phosphatidyltransferase, mitochondrial isoform X2 n=1 Tax=Procambarus clarkii TaxID=6728 RepID=UPI001E674549|nr:CDP-diacylglycerol--glycerol-3-phosphate 3-phosphatidyltransferase, mitochondrial-like isoform X2 [Procambarus clarkii]